MQTQSKMTRVAIMSRVSSDEQAKGYSLDAQYEALVRYCERMNFEIVYEIKEDHSAKSFERPGWKKWIKHVQKNHRDIDMLLITTWDRFTRNASEGIAWIKMHAEKWQIEIQAIEQKIDFSIPEQKAMLHFYLIMPEIDNDRRSIKIKGGIRQALKQGRWPAKGLFGYKTQRDEYGKSGLIPDSKTAPIVLYIFEQVAQGVAQIDLCRELKQTHGIIISRNNMNRILKRAVYMGKIIVPAEKNEPAQLVQGIHEPLISESLFYRVQQHLSGNRKARGKFIPKYAKIRNEFPLRGILKCNHCDGIMTAFSGERGIRTPGTLQYNSFQDCRIRPLCHFSAAKVAIFSY
jgi:site-specific DNA recombinase